MQLVNLDNTKMLDLEFVSLDIETTGLYPKYCEILEIGLIHFSSKGIVKNFNSLILPKNFNDSAIHINGITEHLLLSAPTLEAISPLLFSFLENKALVIQNAEFDLSFLLNDTHTKRILQDHIPVFCSLQLSRKYFPGLNSYSLKSLRKFFNIPDYQKSRGNNSHEALDDCFAAMKVFLECMKLENLWSEDVCNTLYHQKGLKLIKDYRNKFSEI